MTFNPVPGPAPVMDDVNCFGTENKLIECDYNPKPNCFIREAVGVKCKVGGKKHESCFRQSCTRIYVCNITYVTVLEKTRHLAYDYGAHTFLYLLIFLYG